VKVIVKGRAAVDPESDLAESHHVLEEGALCAAGEERERECVCV
jgi:hypothetical protein